MEAEVGKVLTGLGFHRDDWTRNTEEFSGGWQMRIALAKLLLQKPNLLLLDEPTNHLDLEARNWLEEYLTSYPYAYVLISHDRYFLDKVVTRVFELHAGRINAYPGNYEAYWRLRRTYNPRIPGPSVVPISIAANTASSVAITNAPADSAMAVFGLLPYVLPTAMVAAAPSSEASATQK